MDYSGRTGRGEYWKSVFAFLVLQIPVLILDIILAAVLFGGQTPLLLLWRCYGVLGLLAFPAMTVRRLRDAGYSARSLLWLLIPGFGAVAVLARLCTHSTSNDDIMIK